jgi:hypothetical protein
LDVTENKVLCEVCWNVVDQQDFAVCVSCKAPYHQDCRRANGTCPTFQCQGLTSMTNKEYLMGLSRDLPADTAARVQVLCARRAALVEEYRNASCWMQSVGIAYFAIAGLFSLVLGVTNFGPLSMFWAILGLGVVAAVTMVYMHGNGRYLLSRTALVDLELTSLGRYWDGSERPQQPGQKAA